MTVLHLLTNFHPVVGGLENFVLALTTKLPARGVDARVLCLNRAWAGETPLPEYAEVEGVPVHRVGFVHLKFYKPAVLPIAELRAADVIHVHGIGANLDYVAATRRLHGRPLVVSTHGGIFHTQSLARLKRLYFHQVARRSLQEAARVVACGPQDRDIFLPIAPRVEIIENAIDLPPESTAVRDARTCLFVGRFAANKRLDNLLRAFAAAKPNELDLRLRLVGPDWEKLGGGLRQFAGELGISERLSFVGAVSSEQLHEEYARAGLFLSASEHEGFGISAIEAMAGGAVPVLNDIAAFRDLVTSGADGFLVDYADPEKSCAAIAAAAADDLSAMRAAAMRHAADFSWDRQLPRWLALYDEVCAAHS